MLQRAASNAYSWWWASHIRTKQTKWIEQSLQDMEERVHHVLKLIEEDGDSFAKRAEMYYKKRPELISFVEESYRAYRALAERYDHISTELQNANNTIATVFPEQVQFAMDDEDEYASSPRNPKNAPQVSGANVPKVPKVPNRDLKGLLASASKKLKAKKSSRTSNSTKTVVKSGLSEAEAVEEIDKLQKEILALQTVKEFVKSSYESGIAKYWEIENQITEKQEKVFSLQDEFSVGKVIEDDEARTLMAEAALKSCQQTLAQLEEKQERTTKDAKVESKRIEIARDRIKSLKQELFPNQTEQEKSREKDEFAKAEEKKSSKSLNQDTDIIVTKERKELEALREKIKEHFDTDSKASLTVTELTEKMDELVNKVISLETSISSQTALLNRLRMETDDLQSQIKSLEDNKATLINGANDLTTRLREMEAKLRGIQDLNLNVERQNNNLIAHFTEARCNLDHLSDKLHSVKPDEEIEEDIDSLQELEKESDLKNPRDAFLTCRAPKTETTMEDKHEKVMTSLIKKEEEEEEEVSHARVNNDANTISDKSKVVSTSLDEVETSENVLVDPEPEELATEKEEDEPNWQQVLLSGLEDREKILLTEYTAILQNYKDVKKELGEVEKKNQDSLFDLTVQLREMRSAIAKRDEEIQNLRQKLNHLHENFDGSKDLKDDLLNDRSAKPEDTTNQELNVNEIQKTLLTKKEGEEIKLIFVDEHKTVVSPIEEKIQMNIDSILDENLDFWLRFSTSFHQIQKFKTEVQDLEDEIAKLKEKEKAKQEGSTTLDQKSEVRAIYRHLREIQTELTVWLEQSALLKDELKRRFSSLCSIQEEITEAIKEGVEEDEMKFTNYQAAKFQGEVFNMKQETNKVKDELQTGLDHVSGLQLEIEKTLAKLNEEYGISGSKNPNQSQFRHSVSRSRIPLRSFIFGTKPKKQKHSIFSCMNPALHRKYHDLRAGFPM